MIYPFVTISYFKYKRNRYKKIKFDNQYYRDILSYRISEVYYLYNDIYGRNWTKDPSEFELFKQKEIFKDLILINILKMSNLNMVDIKYLDNNNLEIISKDYYIIDGEYKFVYDFIFKEVCPDASVINLSQVNDYINTLVIIIKQSIFIS